MKNVGIGIVSTWKFAMPSVNRQWIPKIILFSILHLHICRHTLICIYIKKKVNKKKQEKIVVPRKEVDRFESIAQRRFSSATYCLFSGLSGIGLYSRRPSWVKKTCRPRCSLWVGRVWDLCESALWLNRRNCRSASSVNRRTSCSTRMYSRKSTRFLERFDCLSPTLHLIFCEIYRKSFSEGVIDVEIGWTSIVWCFELCTDGVFNGRSFSRGASYKFVSFVSPWSSSEFCKWRSYRFSFSSR